MSMTSHAYDRDHSQTMGGRVIPNRRRDSASQRMSEDTAGGSAYGYAPASTDGAGLTGRTPSLASQRTSTFSSASTAVTSPGRAETINNRDQRSHQKSTGGGGARAGPNEQGRSTVVNPALLSGVADAFRERVSLSERKKNELSYTNAFPGCEAVDVITQIIRTNDRNLALLLGRALDAQKLFHDVTYDHRLRDSPHEIYQFRESLMEDSTDVNGVFTLLTDCYSPTCTRDRLCYSIACPRRLEQQARLNLKLQPGLKRQESRSSIHAESDEQKLWINTVSKEVAESVGEKERKRQEVICEIMYTERDFVKDLEYLRDFWMKPLRSTHPANPSPIPEHRREKFIRTVFSNCLDVHAVNGALAKDLTRRQEENPVVGEIGDIFLRYVPLFAPFIKYGSSQLYGKYEFEKERASNPAFARFVDETERLKESRKLELNGYLTKPTTRLARYPLLLENVSKYTADGSPDKQDIPAATKMIREVLSKVNIESGKSENHFNLMQLNQQLKFRPGEYVDLKLTEETRLLIHKGALKKTPSDTSDINAYLFDHAFLLVRFKVVNKREELKVYRKPIPLELLMISAAEEITPRAGIAKRPSSNLIGGLNAPKPDANAKQAFPITFKHLGKGGYELTLYAATQVQRRKWIEFIEAQQKTLRSRSSFFTKTILCDRYFNYAHRVNCLVPIDGGRKLVYGTDSGILMSDRKPKEALGKPRRIIDIAGVTQVEVLEEYQILLVLSNKTLFAYPVDVLESNDPQANNKRPRKIAHANFFKAGVCLSRHLVCCVKTTPSTTIKVYEPTDAMGKGRKKPAFGKLFNGGQDALKPYKEIYIPSESSSIHFLKSKLCVGCAKGFEVVSLETLETQSLLDQADTSLDFVARRENVKPIHIERLNGDFLLNYTDFSFFVNRHGWRARPEWKISWEGQPTSFALSYPYILAFESSFIEIRNVETSALAHIVTARNIRMLHSSTREILYAYEGENGADIIASLDFWNRAQQGPAP